MTRLRLRCWAGLLLLSLPLHAADPPPAGVAPPAELAVLRPAIQALEDGKTGKGVALLMRHAQKGNGEACFILWSVLKTDDPNAATDWLRKAVVLAHPAATHNLARMYLEGSHTVGKDPQQALLLLQRVAAQGLIPAQVDLAKLYQEGPTALQDARMAFLWFERAAEQGHAEGQFRLSQMYLYGHGTSTNAALAQDWLRKAADQGYEPAILARGRAAR